MLWTGICRDCRMAIAPDVEAAIKETSSSSLADVSKSIENVTSVSQTIIKIYIINNGEMYSKAELSTLQVVDARHRLSKLAGSKAKLTGEQRKLAKRSYTT